MEKKKASKGKIILIVIIVFLAIGVISGIANNLTGKTPNKNNADPAGGSVKTSINKDETTQSNTTDLLVCPAFTSEKNTSAAVDEIASLAKENANALDDNQTKDIINSIKNANHNFYSSTDDMEKFMWYGYLLDYKYDDSDPISLLGNDLYQAIKYVYRGEESVTDSATQENLLQIDKDIEAIQ